MVNSVWFSTAVGILRHYFHWNSSSVVQGHLWHWISNPVGAFHPLWRFCLQYVNLYLQTHQRTFKQRFKVRHRSNTNLLQIYWNSQKLTSIMCKLKCTHRVPDFVSIVHSIPSIISPFFPSFSFQNKKNQAFFVLYISVPWCTLLKLYQSLNYMTVNCTIFILVLARLLFTTWNIPSCFCRQAQQV